MRRALQPARIHRQMNDHFATLALPRRPWLDAEALKEMFHRATAEYHPDVAVRGDGERFAGVNVAYNVLRDPAGRLRHLLELEAPEQLSRPQGIPNDVADFFMRLAALRRALDAFAEKESSAGSALSRALLSGEKLALSHQCTEAATQLARAYEQALAAMQALDAEWASHPADAIDRLAALYQQFAYLTKWRSQLREALFKLSS